jgi:hypothetical protein
VKTLDDLVGRATGYSPVERSEAACRQAIRILEDRGWVEAVDGGYRLTPEGLALCDEDERKIDGYFVSCWPDLSEDEVQDLLHITTRLNNRCEELTRAEPESTEG